jgi:hypothetical protein
MNRIGGVGAVEQRGGGCGHAGLSLVVAVGTSA